MIAGVGSIMGLETFRPPARHMQQINLTRRTSKNLLGQSMFRHLDRVHTNPIKKQGIEILLPRQDSNISTSCFQEQSSMLRRARSTPNLNEAISHSPKVFREAFSPHDIQRPSRTLSIVLKNLGYTVSAIGTPKPVSTRKCSRVSPGEDHE